MRVFVTGAAGFIGQATVQELLNHGHQVLGLVRSDASAEIIARLGAEPHRGDLNDLDSLMSGAKSTDAVIHLAFAHDIIFTDFEGANAIDRAAIQAMGEALAGTGKPLLCASGTMGASTGKVVYEDSVPDRSQPMSARFAAADMVLSQSKAQGFRGNVIRLPPTVHGQGDRGFVPMLIDAARKAAVAPYIGAGATRWPAVHRLDAALVFRLALEKGTAGATYHAVSEEGVPMKDIMALIGKRLQVPVESKSVPEALEIVGFLARTIGVDNTTSSEKTQRELGWDASLSRHPTLLEDISANYFA
ncbi:hypothetical protein B0A52_05138 [Exophiala mesophila]|uniref:NAD-dependent epimerase/dehydratase domain-containing protein n=1 Tax=Exophiala mesophila TaxID=212818 RepID=A0A438N7E4_EXOME|nr:hypothetical protein B0A52_05138 [Exophiala mesophila]